MNPRWINWVRITSNAHGAPYEFIGWVVDRWHEWENLTGRKSPHGPEDHVDFDAWLDALPPDGEKLEQMSLFTTPEAAL